MFLRKGRVKSDSALTDSSSKRDNNNNNGNRNKKDLRRASLPSSLSLSLSLSKKPMNGIMKFVSADESIHSVYGEHKKKTKLATAGGGDTDSETNHPASSEEEENGGRSKIRFKDIQIREYARTVGDNPSCSSGPPIAISWEYDPSTKILSIDEYEECREPRRTHFEMVLPRSVRDHMLRQEWGIGRQEIAAAVRANIRTKNQRRATVNNLSNHKGTQAMEELLEKTGRKLMRGLLLKKSTSQQVAELEQQYERAERLRKQALLEQHMKQEYEDDNENEVGGDGNTTNNNDEEEDDNNNNEELPPTLTCCEVQDSDLDSDDPDDMQDMTTTTTTSPPRRRIVAQEEEETDDPLPATTATNTNSWDSPKTVISSDEDNHDYDDGENDKNKKQDTTFDSDRFAAI